MRIILAFVTVGRHGTLEYLGHFWMEKINTFVHKRLPAVTGTAGLSHINLTEMSQLFWWYTPPKFMNAQLSPCFVLGSPFQSLETKGVYIFKC